METELQSAEATRDFVDGSSGSNLQMTQHFTLPLALERWRWIYIAPKKLKTSLVDPLVLISHLRNRLSSHWLSRMEMELHCAKETRDFGGGSSGPNLQLTTFHTPIGSREVKMELHWPVMFASTSSKAPKNCPHLKKPMRLGFNHFLECLSASRHVEFWFGDSSGFERRVTFLRG